MATLTRPYQYEYFLTKTGANTYTINAGGYATSNPGDGPTNSFDLSDDGSATNAYSTGVQNGDQDNYGEVNEAINIDGGSWATEAYIGRTASFEVLTHQNDSNDSYVLYTNSTYATNTTITVTSDSTQFCFARGTLIATPEGQIPVEQLQIGSLVQNQQGQAVAVKWMGRQTKNAVIAKMTDGLPVCIQQGALGHGLPLRDLYVSPDHAMLVDGLLVHASALVNGRTITQVESWQGPVAYFHIETEAHEIVLAEGAAAETFIDNVSRQTFDNYAEYEALYPNAEPMQELALPRVKFARQLPRAVAHRLEAVADALHGEAALA